MVILHCAQRHVFQWSSITIIYHINYGVLEGFTSLKKSVTTHVKKWDFFSRAFDIVNQRWYVTRLSLHSSFAPLGQVDEWTAKSSPFSIQGHLSEFLGLWRLKQFKIPYRLRTVTFKTFLDREKNENKKRKTESYVFSGCGNGISLRWDRKSTVRRFATGRLAHNDWVLRYNF